MVFFRRESNLQLILSGTLILVVVAVIDYKTGFEFGFSVFYLLPILVFTWIGGKFAGISLTVIGILLWAEVDILAGHASVNPRGIYLSAAAEFLLFLVSMALLLKLKSSYERERQLSRIDPLTGLANRRFFLELTKIEQDWCRRHQKPLTIAYLDVDNFKTVNDTRGHQAGDALLKEIARTITENVRSLDIAARLGGDEFVVMFPELEAERVRMVLDRFLNHLRTRMRAGSWPVTFSIGAVTYYDLDHSLEEMITQSDQLMYEAKKAGKNTLRHVTVGGEAS
ncbi:MAG: GGDEF domain-containing protein [Calditrichaceae bacterium]|nr:GGDEF domain-containing protein [Calditrichia bacterium]NUQ41178.1 GGDEF domain-containing protein [Calditrichaceae bacterium]